MSANGALAVVDRPIALVDAQEWNRDRIETLKRTIAKGATDSELELAVGICQRTGLSPEARQIFFIKRWDATEKREVMSAQVSIDGFRLVAERSRKYAGQIGPQWCGPDGQWQDVWLSDGDPAAARVAVLRTDWKEPLWAVARFRSYVQTTREGRPTRMWATMPDVMIAKVAEALALRRAFPAELSGVYTVDEMAQAENPASVPQDAQERPQPRQAPAPDQQGQRAPQRPPAAPETVQEAEYREVVPVTGGLTWPALFEGLKPLGIRTKNGIAAHLQREIDGLSPTQIAALFDGAGAVTPTPSTDSPQPSGLTLSDAQNRKIHAVANEKFGSEGHAIAHAVAAMNFGAASLKVLTKGDAAKLIDYLDTTDADEIRRYVSEELRQQAMAKGQQEMVIETPPRPVDRWNESHAETEF